MATNLVRHYRTTKWCIAVGAVNLILAFFLNFDIIQIGSWFANALQPHHVDNIVTAMALVIIGISIDHWQEKRWIELESLVKQLNVLKATMRTVHDVVNNYLNNMQLVHLEAGDALSQETLELLERITFETVSKLKAMGDLESVPEKEMAVGMGIA